MKEALRKPQYFLLLTAGASTLAFILVGVFSRWLYFVFPTSDYLGFHNILELTSVIVGFAVFLVNFQAYRQNRNSHSLFIGASFLAIAAIDLIHTLSYNGMPDFITANSVSKAAVYWIVARLWAASALLISAFVPARSNSWLLRRSALLLWNVALALAVLVVVSYLPQYVPAMYVPGEGLTPLKVVLEYLVIALSLGGILAYWRVYKVKANDYILLLMGALTVTIFSELAFTAYASAYDTYNLLGHLYKVAAYGLVFQSLFVSSIEFPYRQLSRTNEQLASTVEELNLLNNENSQLYEREQLLLEREKNKTRELFEVNRFLNSSLGLKETLTAIAESARGLLNAEAAAVLFLDQTTSTFSLQAWAGFFEVENLILPLQDTLAARVVQRDQPETLSTQQEASAYRYPLKLLSGPPRSLLCAPLKAKGRLIGVVEVYGAGFKLYDQTEIELLSSFADAAGVAIQNANLYDEAVQERVKTRTVVDVCADGIMVVDAQQTVISVNPALEELSGFQADELVGQHCRHLLGARCDNGEYICDVTCPFLQDAPGKSVEATLARKDGREIWVGVSYGMIREEEGRLAGVVQTFRDMTERRELDRLKDEFISTASHDLKTPVTSIKGYTQLALRRIDSLEGDQLKKMLSIIDAQSDYLAQLVNTLLDASRIQAGRLVVSKEPVDMVALIRQLVERTKSTAERHRLLLEADPEVIIGQWSRSRLEQVLANLVGNAVKYSPNGGEVRISATSRENQVLVSVRDQGMGIPEAEQKRLFERFYRAPSTTFGGLQGTGLGLYICKAIVEAHDGRIWVESKEGGGSTFSFTLPLQ